jgi:hypothetical protein
MVRKNYFLNRECKVNDPLGHLDFGKLDYKDASGYNLDTQVLVFKLKF